jgi:hypothetical protein
MNDRSFSSFRWFLETHFHRSIHHLCIGTYILLGNRVARIEGTSYTEVEDLLDNYQFQNTKLDLFSEAGEAPWGDGKIRDPMKTPRTTARFLPGYDWDKDKGFFDDAADKASTDFEDQYGNWLPNIEDE